MKFTRLMIGDIYLEKDVNNEPRMILKDEFGEEWVMSAQTTQHGFSSIIEKKSTCWFFNENNRTKPVTEWE